MLVNDKKSARISSTTWPGLIISYHPSPITPICVALFDDDRPTTCDIHDCVIADVSKLSSIAIMGLTQFCDIPPIPKRIIDVLTYPEPYRSKWIDSVSKEITGIVQDRKAGHNTLHIHIHARL